MPENPTSENERQFNPELHQDAIQSLQENFDLNTISKEFSELQETIDPYEPGIRSQKETFTETEWDQGALYDAAAGFWNSFVVGSVEGAFNLLPTISNAVAESEWANSWIEKVNKVADNFEYIYSDDYYKPIEKFGDISSSHFWAGLGNGIGFVTGIGKFAKAGQLLSKGGRALRRGRGMIAEADPSNFYKAGAIARNFFDDAAKKVFKSSKTAKVSKKTPKFKNVDPIVRESMEKGLRKIESRAQKGLKNSARLGSFLGGTTMMYNMVQDEAREAGLDPTSAARFSLGVASVVSLTEGAALEWIGKIPARSVQKQIIKAASKKAFKSASKKSPKQVMDSFLPTYTKALRGVDLFEGAAVEFGQEFGQTYIEEGAKQMYDEIFAKESATVGKGKFGTEVFDLDADSVGGFFTDGKDSKKTFTNSVFAGILGGIIGGGMAGIRLRSIPGERNLGNESMFNLIADDVINKTEKNREGIQKALEKALKSKNITQKDVDATNELIKEMGDFVTQNNVVKLISDPIAQYQLFNLHKSFKRINSEMLTEEQVREQMGDAIDSQVEEAVKLNEEKNKLYNKLLDAIEINSLEIWKTSMSETLNADEFNDKMNAYDAIKERIKSGEIDNITDLETEINKIYDTDFKKTFDKAEEDGKLLKEVTEEEYNKFKEDGEVSQKRINYLAQKLINEVDFNEYEEEMFKSKEEEVNEAKEKFEEKEKSKETKTEETKTEETETKDEAEPFASDKYAKALKEETDEGLKAEEENIRGDKNEEEKRKIIGIEKSRRKIGKKPESKPKTETKPESESKEETKSKPRVHKTATSLRQSEKDDSLNEDDIRETYNKAKSDLLAGKRKKSANAIITEIEKKAKKDKKYSDAIKPKKDEKTEGSKETDKDSKEEEKVEPTTDTTTDVKYNTNSDLGKSLKQIPNLTEEEQASILSYAEKLDKTTHKNSTLRNPDGTLKIMFHGSKRVFKDFKSKMALNTTEDESIEGYYFSDSYETASDYANLIFNDDRLKTESEVKNGIIYSQARRLGLVDSNNKISKSAIEKIAANIKKQKSKSFFEGDIYSTTGTKEQIINSITKKITNSLDVGKIINDENYSPNVSIAFINSEKIKTAPFKSHEFDEKAKYKKQNEDLLIVKGDNNLSEYIVFDNNNIAKYDAELSALEAEPTTDTTTEQKTEEVEVEEIKPTTKETTDIVKIEKETSVEVLREYDNAEINAIAKNRNNEAVEGLGQLISKDVKEVEGGKAEQEVYQYGVIQRITSEDGSKIQRVTDHYGKVYGIPIINLNAKEAGFFFDGKKEFSLTQKQITDFFNSKFGKPKTEEDVVKETAEDVGDDAFRTDNPFNSKKNNQIDNQNTKNAEISKEKIKKSKWNKDDDILQRKGVLSKANDAQKISDNPILFAKIKNHFKKMFPKIPVETVNKLFDKYGVEVLGKVSQEGITISEQAFQSTLVHEYSHVYLDLIADKDIVENSLEWIKTTNYFINAKKSYPNDTVQTQAMEALVQAMSENSIPKLEEKLSEKQINRWTSIAKKLWRAIKRLFTGVNSKNYVDYLSDQLVFQRKPIMVDTSYLKDSEQYERKAVDASDANFNNKFLLRTIKKFAMNALIHSDKTFTRENVFADMKSMMVDEIENEDFIFTNKLNNQYNILNDSEEKFNEKTFKELNPLEQLDILLDRTIYEDGITYGEHIKTTVEYLSNLPIEGIKESEVNKLASEEQSTESETGKIQKEAIKGSKKMLTSVNSILSRITDSDGKPIHQDDVFAYLTKAAMQVSTVEELKRKIEEDSKGERNEIPLSLFNVLLAIKDYDQQFGNNTLQTVLHQALSNQAIPQKSTVIRKDKDEIKQVTIYNVSKSQKRKQRTASLKRELINPQFLDLAIIGTEKTPTKSTIKDILFGVVNASGSKRWGFMPDDSRLKFEVSEVEALGNKMFDVNGEFKVIDYINYLASETEILKTKSTRSRAIQQILNKTNEKEKQRLAAKFFMSDLLNTAAEQLNKYDNINNPFYGKLTEVTQGKVKDLMNFASFKYDVSNVANMFINSAGNTVSTIRFGSYLNRVFGSILRQSESAKRKNNKKVETEKGDVYLWRNNPVFKMIFDGGLFNWAIDDAINYQETSIKEHSQQNAIDLFLNQLMFFSNDQNRIKYYQKAIINDRSHSNFVEVLRLDDSAIKNHLNEQRLVDQYFLNEGYERIDNAEYSEELTEKQIEAEKLKRKKAYLEEFNKLSLNFAYDVNGKVIVKNFDPVYVGLSAEELQKKLDEDKDLNEIEKKGLNQKARKVNSEVNQYKNYLEKVGLENTIQRDHVSQKEGDNELYENTDKMLRSFILNDKVNRLAVNDIIAGPIAKKLIKKGKIDRSNILKRNSGYDSTGLKVDLSEENTGKKTMTVVYELNDEDGNPISDSFLWRSKGMTEEIQKQLGDPLLDEISYNSKDGEYMIDENGNNIYHKNSSVNYIGSDKENNILDMAKATRPDTFDKKGEESNYYRIAKMLELLEKQYGKTHHIQIIDKDSIKGSMDTIKAMSIKELYNFITNNDFKAIDSSKYEYNSENFYIPFNENKKKKALSEQMVKLATQAVKIWTNNTVQNDALLEAKELEIKIVDYLLEQMGAQDVGNDYKDSYTGKKLFGTETILNSLLERIDDLQDPDTAQLLKDIISYNKKEGKVLSRARKRIAKNEEKFGGIDEYTPDVKGYSQEIKTKWIEDSELIENKETINKLDHPAMTAQLKQVILSKLQSAALDVRVPGAYLKMVPDLDGRLGDNEIILPWSMFGETREQAEKFLKEQDEKGGVFVPGVRVPASDAISTLNARVVGLIEGDSNVAILPHGFTIKSDADHDGDKVFIYRMDLKTKDGKTVVKEDSKANSLYKTITRLSQSKDYKQRIKDGTINLNEFEKLVNEIDRELKGPDIEAINVIEGVNEIFNENPELAEIGTKGQYSAYLNTITSEPIVYKGFRNKSGRVHKTPNHTFYTADKNIAAKWYKSDEGVLAYAVLKGSSESFNAERKKGESEVRQDEENFINKSNANYVKLQTLDIGGEQLQYVVNKKNTPLQLGSKEDAQAFRDFVSKSKTKGKGLASNFDFGTIAQMSATDARMSFGEIAVGILAVAGKLNSALYQANTTFKKEKTITIDGKEYTLDKVNAPKTSNDLAMLLQAALDMSSNPILLRSGIDAKNINVVVAMLIGGIPLKTAIKFVNKQEIKSHYSEDQTQNNAYTEKANKDKFQNTLEQKIKDEEAKEEGSEIKENLETLQYFSQLSQELNAVTSIVQLDGSLPNDGYLLRDVKKIFGSLKSEKNTYKLNYQNFVDRPLNRHYENVVDLGIDLMTHHFITENPIYYDEIEKIEKSREYSDVRHFDPSVEKRKVDDMFSLMLSQELLDESQIADIMENGVQTVIESLKNTVRESIQYSYSQITKNNSAKAFIKEYIENLNLGEAGKAIKQNELDDYFNVLKEEIEIDGSVTNIGAFVESLLDLKNGDVKETLKIAEKELGKKINKDIVKVVKDYKLFKEYEEQTNFELGLIAKNKFIKLLELTERKEKETDVTESVLSGRHDNRYLTTTEKQLAKRDFQKLDYDIQNRFLAYQLLKYGLSNKLGSIISIMPNQFTLDYLKNISNIDHVGEKENKKYVLAPYRIAQSYNDLNYPVKVYKKSNKLLEEGGKEFLYTNKNEKIKGSDGVRFKIEGDENLYVFKKVEGLSVNEVKRVTSFAAERKQNYTLFNNEKTISLKEAEEDNNSCKKGLNS